MARASTPPSALAAQARAVERVTMEARRYFDDPSEPLVVFVRKARVEARKRRTAADADIEKVGGADWFVVSAALAELADEACWAAEEGERFKARLGVLGRRLAEAQESAAARLAAALGGRADAAAAVVEAKNKALQIEDIRRRARKEALEQPRLAAELSAQAVLDRFSRAAEAVQKAADVLAGRLGEGA